MSKWIVASAAIVMISTSAWAQNAEDFPSQGQCSISRSTIATIQKQLAFVTNPANFPDANGGLFSPNRMWSAIVDRQGVLCSVINTGNDPWPGSRSIAIAKASTANDFSNSAFALSTANLYAQSQPGVVASPTYGTGINGTGSLWGLNNSNPFNPFFQQQNSGIGFVPGGIITFGGGVALYQGEQVIGGLGVSGDTSCADHAIAYRMRHLAGLDGVPNGPINGTDNISYAPFGVPPSGFQQPHCTGTNASTTKDITP
jgi:uncharacterized protein GlcG (DUF336 family)